MGDINAVPITKRLICPSFAEFLKQNDLNLNDFSLNLDVFTYLSTMQNSTS